MRLSGAGFVPSNDSPRAHTPILTRTMSKHTSKRCPMGPFDSDGVSSMGPYFVYGI